MRQHKYTNRCSARSCISKKVACLFMSFVMAAAMTGCGKDKTESVPDLLDPVSTNEAYRPVTYGDIGRIDRKTHV